MSKSDIEIAREATMQPIADIGAKLDIPAEHLHHFGPTTHTVSQAPTGTTGGTHTSSFTVHVHAACGTAVGPLSTSRALGEHAHCCKDHV